MKITELLTEAPFTKMNFPADAGGEQLGPDHGSRTLYVQGEKNTPEAGGFPLRKDTEVFDSGGDTKQVLKKGTRVLLIRPGVLYRGATIGIKPEKAIFTEIGLEGNGADDSIGFVKIINIEKPSGGQTRLSTGKQAQNIVADSITTHLQNNGHEAHVLSTATPGSQKPDVILNVDNAKVQFEVKGASNPTAMVTLFDKSSRRGQAIEILDRLANAYTRGKITSYSDLIDAYREGHKELGFEGDPTTGFPGDEGAPKSGKVPKHFRFDYPKDRVTLIDLRQEIIEHLRDGGDNYFAYYNTQTKQTYVWHVFGPNPLGAPQLPGLMVFNLDTYGGASAGALRTGIKIKFMDSDPVVIDGSQHTEQDQTKKSK